MQISPAVRRFGFLLGTAILTLSETGRAQPADPAPAKLVADGPALPQKWAPAEFPAELLNQKDQRIRQVLVVRTVIDATGKVTAARVLDPGDERFNAAALAAVKSWDFKPAIADGEPVACGLDIPVEFDSEKARKKAKPALAPEPRFEPYPSPRTQAESQNSPSGEYPAVLTERKLPGIVHFTCRVTADGHALNPRIAGASHADFVLPALEALKRWTFSPATEGDLAVPSDLEGRMTFDLDAAPSRNELLAANGLTEPGGAAPEDAPALVAMADVVYPIDPLLAGEGGTASVAFTVNIQGTVVGAKVVEASQPAFGQALVAAAESWIFEPAMKDGAAAEVQLVKKMTFVAVPKSIPDDADALTKLVADLRVDGRIGSARGLDARLEPLYRAAPIYPWSLRDDGRPAGQAIIEIVIDREGRARLPKVVSASREEFGWAAATAAAQWVFKPAHRAGAPVAVKARIPFEFAPPTD